MGKNNKRSKPIQKYSIAGSCEPKVRCPSKEDDWETIRRQSLRVVEAWPVQSRNLYDLSQKALGQGFCGLGMFMFNAAVHAREEHDEVFKQKRKDDPTYYSLY